MARPHHLVLITLLSVACSVLAQDEMQSVESIRAIAEAAFTAAPGVEAQAALDTRLRLPRCEQAMRAVPHGAATVEVSCPGAAGWRLFVPVRVSRHADVLVLTRPVAAGTPIRAESVGLERREVSRLQGAPLDRTELAVGRIARRAIAAGTALTAADLALPNVIRRGQSVTLVARQGNLEVRASGRALADAAPGDVLSVENPVSRRVVQGIAQGDGEVVVR